MSHRYCLKLTKSHCTSFSGLRAVEESSVGGRHRVIRLNEPMNVSNVQIRITVN